MATVYKAFQPSLEREVALKVLRPTEFLEGVKLKEPPRGSGGEVA